MRRIRTGNLLALVIRHEHLAFAQSQALHMSVIAWSLLVEAGLITMGHTTADPPPDAGRDFDADRDADAAAAARLWTDLESNRTAEMPGLRGSRVASAGQLLY